MTHADIITADDASPSAGTAIMQYGAAALLTVFATAIAVGVDSRIAIPNVSMVYVVPVVIAGAAFGTGPSLLAALLGALSYNWFLTEPRYTFTVDDPANIWAIGLLFLVGLIVSGIAFVSHRKAREAREWQQRATLLQKLSTEITTSSDPASAAATALTALFAAPSVVMMLRDEQLRIVSGSGDLQAAEWHAARSALDTAQPVRGGVYPDPDSRFDFWPVTADGRALGVIGVAFGDERPHLVDVSIDVVRNLLALRLRPCRPSSCGSH